MSADSAIAEALARIEHKVDVAIGLSVRLLNVEGMPPEQMVRDLPAVGDPSHLCPLCGKNPKYLIDIFAAIITRQCACGTGKVAIDLQSLAPPTQSRSSYAGSDGVIDQPEDGGSTRSHPGLAQQRGNPTR